MKKCVNGNEIEMTAEELASFEQHQLDLQNIYTAQKAEEETAKQAKETAQASGNQKLLDLGLTQAEATALTGYTPPVEE